jgi:hypothetical protein
MSLASYRAAPPRDNPSLIGAPEAPRTAKAEPDRFAGRRGSPPLCVMALVWLTTLAGERGTYEAGRRSASEAIKLAEEARHPWSRAAAYFGLEALLIAEDKAASAIPVLEKGLRIRRHIWRPGPQTVTRCLGALQGRSHNCRSPIDATAEIAIRGKTGRILNAPLSLRLGNSFLGRVPRKLAC